MCRLHTWVCVLCAILSSSFSGVPRYSSQAGANFCAFTVFLLGASDFASHAKGLPTTVTLPLPSPSKHPVFAYGKHWRTHVLCFSSVRVA